MFLSFMTVPVATIIILGVTSISAFVRIGLEVNTHFMSFKFLRFNETLAAFLTPKLLLLIRHMNALNVSPHVSNLHPTFWTTLLFLVNFHMSFQTI